MGTAALASLRRTGKALLVALGVRPVPVPCPRERLPKLCADLHRLDVEVGRLLVADRRTPALRQRLRAVSWAYDAVLYEACLTAGLPAMERAPFEASQRLLAEAGLVAAGVRW